MTEEALKESEERFRGHLRERDDRYLQDQPRRQGLMANPALVAMLGYASFEELASRNLSEEGFEPDYPRSYFQDRIARDGEIRGLESAWTRRDGSVAFVRRAPGRSGMTTAPSSSTREIVEDIGHSPEAVRRGAGEEERPHPDGAKISPPAAGALTWTNRSVWTDEAARIHEQPPPAFPPPWKKC